jgi:hypothetical protein
MEGGGCILGNLSERQFFLKFIAIVDFVMQSLDIISTNCVYLLLVYVVQTAFMYIHV